MKKTAVEWLGKKLESYGDPQYCELKWEELDLLIKKAKQMEKEQIIDAFQSGDCRLSAEQYYNETFKK
jgi:hypothetical protein